MVRLFLLGSLPVMWCDSLTDVNLLRWGWAHSDFGVGWKATPGIFRSLAACVGSGSIAQLLCGNLDCCGDNGDAHATLSSRPLNTSRKIKEECKHCLEIGRREVLPNKVTWKHEYPLPCMYRATSALEGLFPCLRPDGSLSRLRVMSGVLDPVDVFQACRMHASRKELLWLWRWFYAVVAGRLERKGVAGSFLSMSVDCNTRTPGLNWLYPEGFQNLTSQLPGEGLYCERLFPVHYRYLATWERLQGLLSRRHLKWIQWCRELHVGRIPLTPEAFWQRGRRIVSPQQFAGFRCYSFCLSH